MFFAKLMSKNWNVNLVLYFTFIIYNYIYNLVLKFKKRTNSLNLTCFVKFNYEKYYQFGTKHSMTLVLRQRWLLMRSKNPSKRLMVQIDKVHNMAQPPNRSLTNRLLETSCDKCSSRMNFHCIIYCEYFIIDRLFLFLFNRLFFNNQWKAI